MPHQPIFAGPDRFGPVLEEGKVNLRTTNDVGVPSSCACWRSSIQPQGALNVGPDPEREVRWTNLVSCRHRYQVAGNVKDSPGLYHRFGYQLGCKVDELDREMNTIQKCGCGGCCAVVTLSIYLVEFVGTAGHRRVCHFTDDDLKILRRHRCQGRYRLHGQLLLKQSALA